MRRRDFIKLLGGFAGQLPARAQAMPVVGSRHASSLDSQASRSSVDADGYAGAPAGSPQYPDLLSGHHRPPWKVAGVDYYVGIDRSLYPSNSNLKSAAVQGNLPAGATISGSSVTVHSASAVTLDGFDFTNLGLNWSGGGGTLLVTNCLFKLGSSNIRPVAVNAAGLTMRYCEIDGNGRNGQTGSTAVGELVYGYGSIVEYCYIHDGWSDAVRPDYGGTQVLRFNLFRDFSYDATAHADYCQISNAYATDGKSTNDNCVFSFNTGYQTNAGGNNLNSMFRLNTQMTNPTVSHNTGLGLPVAQINYWIEVVEVAGSPPSGDAPSKIVNLVCTNNYFLPDSFGHLTISVGGYSGSIVNPTVTGNINISNGAPLLGAAQGPRRPPRRPGELIRLNSRS